MTRGQRSRRRGIGLLVRAAWFAPLLFVGTAGTAERPATRPGPSLPEQVLSELRAAHAARGRLLAEEQAWAMEKAGLELLTSTVRGEAKRLAAAAAKANQEESDLRKRTADLQAGRQRLKLVEAMVDALAERLEQALDALAHQALPGVVPPDIAADITDPARRLAAAAQRLNEVRQRTAQSGIELVVGSLGGESVTVKLLRAGGVAAWWTSLDGERAGTAARADGKLVLSPAEPPEDAAIIRKAFAIVEGRAAPHWVLLPIRPAEPKQEAATRP